MASVRPLFLLLVAILAMAGSAMGGSNAGLAALRRAKKTFFKSPSSVAPALAAVGSLATDLAALQSFKADILKNKNSKDVVALLTGWTGSNPCLWEPVITCDKGRVTSIRFNVFNIYGSPGDPLFINGGLNAKFSTLNMLQVLHFFPNSTIPFPAVLLEMKSLRELEIRAVASLPSRISSLTNLNILDVQAYGPIPASIGKLTRLQELQLSGFNGTVPAEITNLKSLQLIIFGFSKLTGLIWPVLETLTSLKEIVLYKNKFTGPAISPSIGKLKSLEYLYVHNERGLTGPIPLGIGSLVNLIGLVAKNITLTGTIPAHLAKLPLTTLDLSHNNLTGTIPTELTKLSLYRVDLSYNNLTGVLPPSVTAWMQNTRLESRSSIASNYLAGNLTSSKAHYNSNCFGLTACNKVVAGQRPFSECSKVYPALTVPCKRPPPPKKHAPPSPKKKSM